jgi:hypothetical protein
LRELQFDETPGTPKMHGAPAGLECAQNRGRDCIVYPVSTRVKAKCSDFFCFSAILRGSAFAFPEAFPVLFSGKRL